MNTKFFYFLIESSIYLLFFLAIYRLAISNLTHFNWMRGYLLLSLSLSLILPLVKIPGQWSHSLLGNGLFDKPFLITNFNPLMVLTPSTIDSGTQPGPGSDVWASIIFVLSAVYFTGAFYKLITLFRNLRQISESIKNNPKHKEGKYWIVSPENNVAVFSFLNFIFIGRNVTNLTSQEIQQIKNHEQIHASHRHTLDILFVEIIGIIFWFSPLVRYAKIKIQELHEYIADEKTAGNGEIRRSYARLLFNLASEAKVFCLSTGFSGKQINNRIVMVSKTRSLPRHKLIFVSLIPVAAFLLLSFSYFDHPVEITKTSNQNMEVNSATTSDQKIGSINWVNNTVFTSAELNKILGMKKGDEYSKNNLQKRLYDEDGVATRYMDKGYLFANVEFSENPASEGIVDLTITIYEGLQGKIGNVSIRGNKHVSTEDILAKITVKPGDWFSKTKLLESVRALSMMGKFDNEKIKPEVNPLLPQDLYREFHIVNIIFNVTEQ